MSDDQINNEGRRLYPMTAEIIDRAEENTANNLSRYIEEERQRRQQEQVSQSQALSEQEIDEALNPNNLSPTEKRMVETWTADGLTRRRMAELLIYEM